MAKLTWLGPDDYEAGETPPRSCTWNGIEFPRGVAVEVDNPTMIAKARGNRMFKLEGEPATVQWREPATEAEEPDVSFFDDPPESEPPEPEMEAAATWPELPPDYPPEDDPERVSRRKGRPPRIR